MPVIECDVSKARDRLESAGVEVRPGNTDHERWRAVAEDATAVAYADKVVVQGQRPEQLEGVLRAEGVIGDGGGRAHVYFDGASRGNPGPAAIGWVILNSDGIVTEGNDRIGRTTNNRAEYAALVRALEVAISHGFDEVDIRSDSELLVKQVTGQWNVNQPELREYRVQALELLQEFDDWSLSHVPREINERADELANEAFDHG